MNIQYLLITCLKEFLICHLSLFSSAQCLAILLFRNNPRQFHVRGYRYFLSSPSVERSAARQRALAIFPNRRQHEDLALFRAFHAYHADG